MLRWTNLSSASGKEGLEILINTFLPTLFLRSEERVDEQSDVGGESPARVYYASPNKKFKILVVCY
jgi:hypothetical protein